jgi:signal transduction histidine kinase
MGRRMGVRIMKYFLNLAKVSRFFADQSLAKRLTLTIIGIFMIGYMASAIGIRVTNNKLTSIFNEIEARNKLAATKTLKHDLEVLRSNLILVAESNQISDWYDYKKFGLGREEKRAAFAMEQFFIEAAKGRSGIAKIFMTTPPCPSDIQFDAIAETIRVCVDSRTRPISVTALASTKQLLSRVQQFIPDAKIVKSMNYVSGQEIKSTGPGIDLEFPESNRVDELMRSFLLTLPLLFTVLLIGIVSVLFIFWSKFLLAQNNVLNYISSTIAGESENVPRPNLAGFDELRETMNSVVEKIIAYEQVQKENELINLSKQIAHDIRSPLSALNMLSKALPELSEDKRTLIRSSVNRINDIANGLLVRGRNHSTKPTHAYKPPNDDSTPHESIMVSALIDSIVSEKRVQFRENPSVGIDAEIETAYGLFISGSTVELKRVISNLVNNSIEALNGKVGKIVVGAKLNLSEIEIFVTDTGVGIPPEMIKYLGTLGFTSGKSNTDGSGNGLGLSHAYHTVKKSGGNIRIESKVGSGTCITLLFPKTTAPNWFVKNLNIVDDMRFVVLDDDSSIHHIWNQRLAKMGPDVKVTAMSFTSGETFKKWVFVNGSENCTFLIDYELLGQPQTGLDIIQELGLQESAILVTSRYDEQNILARCNRLGVRLIPKDVCPLVPFSSSENTDSGPVHISRNTTFQNA